MDFKGFCFLVGTSWIEQQIWSMQSLNVWQLRWMDRWRDRNRIFKTQNEFQQRNRNFIRLVRQSCRMQVAGCSCSARSPGENCLQAEFVKRINKLRGQGRGFIPLASTRRSILLLHKNECPCWKLWNQSNNSYVHLCQASDGKDNITVGIVVNWIRRVIRIKFLV